MDGMIKVGVGDYYFYDSNNNQIGLLKTITKEVFSCEPTMCGYNINLLNVRVDMNLLQNIKQLDRIVVDYSVTKDGSEIKNAYYTLQNARIENYKIVSKKNDAAFVNFKISTTSIDSCQINNIKLYKDYIKMSIKDTLGMINSIWNDFSDADKLDICQEIIELYNRSYGNELISMIKDCNGKQELRAGFGNVKLMK